MLLARSEEGKIREVNPKDELSVLLESPSEHSVQLPLCFAVIFEMLTCEAFLRIKIVRVMALAFPVGVDEAAALKYLGEHVSADLAHLLQDAGVPIELQYNLTQAFKTVKRFSAYADDRPGVRDALKADLALEPTDMAKWSAIASVVSAWEACKDYASKESELRAQSKFLGVTRPVLQNERLAMKQAYEKTNGSLEEAFEPSDDYLSAKIEEFESAEPAASPLHEITSKKIVRTQGLQTTIDKGGQVRIVKQKQRGQPPQGTEELCTVLRVEGNTWSFMAGKFRNVAFFKNMSPEPWFHFTNLILGEKVFLMRVPVSGKGKDNVPIRPPWQVLLSYEYELRKEAVKLAWQNNSPLAETLIEVTKNAELKEQFFPTPIALQHFSQSSSGYSERELAPDGS